MGNFANLRELEEKRDKSKLPTFFVSMEPWKARRLRN